jgi:orotate phosphoribosyltransferase
MRRSASNYGWTSGTPDEFMHKMDNLRQAASILLRKLDVNTIAFSGSSGCAAAFSIACGLPVGLCYVRKPSEKSESHGNEVEATTEFMRYIIVDDFVASGNTVRRIDSAIRETAKRLYTKYDVPVCVGILTFDGARNCSSEQINGSQVPLFNANWILDKEQEDPNWQPNRPYKSTEVFA